MNEKYGHWETNGVKFGDKYKALRYATQHNTKVEFKYFDHIWANFNRELMGKVPLTTLYKERAQQLRDRYQYLILYYSGGADSHNVLRAFTDNNIKLDEVVVRWPEHALYTPNSADTSPSNFWSEWDYAIKPSLEWLAGAHPEIKITIKHMSSAISDSDMISAFDRTNYLRTLTMLLNTIMPESSDIMAEAGLTVGHIYGVDKPLLKLENDNKLWMIFSDHPLTFMTPPASDPSSVEGFYWAPEFPEIIFEMAYQTSLYFDINKDHRKFLNTKGTNVQFQNEVVKKMCYHTWDNRFQSNIKAGAIYNQANKFHWFYTHESFKRVREVYNYTAKSKLDTLDPRFILNIGYVTFPTSKFYIRTLNP